MGLRYFAEINGETTRFDRVDNRNQSTKNDNTWGWHEATKQWVKITRVVNYKAFASKHECDARCMNASGRTMNCECACGGKNHGKGGFLAEAA